MPRPLSVSDDAILDATRRVLIRRGYAAMTLSEIGEEAGLSRAAISLRFKTVRELTVRLGRRTIAEFEADLGATQPARCGEHLIELARALGAAITSGRADMATIMLALHPFQADEDIGALYRDARAVLESAAAMCMPPTTLPEPEAVTTFMCHLKGCLQQLQFEPAEPGAHLAGAAERWLTLARIPVGAVSR